MAELSVVRRYARALFDTANSSSQVDLVEADLKTVDDLLRTVPRLPRALRAPTISSQRKKELLTHTFGTRVGPLTQRFLALVVTRNREDILGQVYAEFHRLSNELRNILPVDVTAAVPMTDAERDALGNALARRTGKQVVLRVAIDPRLMGGVVLRMGDTIIDGSVRNKLLQLRARLSSGRTT